MSSEQQVLARPRGAAAKALAALALGLAVGFGAARALPAAPAGRGGERGVSSSDGAGGARRGDLARPGLAGGRAGAAGRAGEGGREGLDGLGDDLAAIVLEEVRAAIAATSTAESALSANAGGCRISGRVRSLDGAPVAGVTVEARRIPDPLPAPSEEEARRLALEGRDDEAGQDPLDELLRGVRAAARDLVRRRAQAPLAVTGADGGYAIPGLAPGRYVLRAEAEGWTIRPRREEGALDDLAAEGPVSLGGAGEAGEVVRDWTAERAARVRFEGEGPGGAAPTSLYVDVRGADSWSAKGGAHRPLTLVPGLHVAQARGVFAGDGPGAADRTLWATEPFVAGPESEPRTILLRFREHPRVSLRVESDDPATEEWHRVRVIVMPTGDGSDGVAWTRLADGTRRLEVGTTASWMGRGEGNTYEAELPPLPPGLYAVEARRDVEPPEEPGPRTTLEVRATGDSDATVRLPPSGRAVRITARLESLPPGEASADVEIMRRARGAHISIASASLEPGGGEGEAIEARFALRPVEVVDPGGAPAELLARVSAGGFRAEATVPRGREATVVLRFPEAARLALEVDPGGHDGPAGDLMAVVGTLDGEDVLEEALEAKGGGRRLTAVVGPLGAGAYVVRVRPGGEAGGSAPALASARVTLAPGENALSLTLLETAAASILPPSDGTLRIVAAASAAVAGAGVLHQAGVQAGVPAPLPPLPPGLYVALLEGARDPFAEPGAPRERAAMTFRLPGSGPAIPFAPEAVDGWTPRFILTWSAYAALGLRHGDVLVTIDGAAPADPWEPLTPLLDAPPREPDVARVTLLRDGAPVTVDLSLATLRASDERDGFVPVPGDR